MSANNVNDNIKLVRSSVVAIGEGHNTHTAFCNEEFQVDSNQIGNRESENYVASFSVNPKTEESTMIFVRHINDNLITETDDNHGIVGFLLGKDDVVHAMIQRERVGFDSWGRVYD